jgi:hypothetical protein
VGAALVVLAAVAATSALAQQGFLERFRRSSPDSRDAAYKRDNTQYDGKFVFIRLRYGGPGGFGFFGDGGGPGWAHDYPRADVNFMRILQEITLLKPRTNGSNILSPDDPELFDFPVAYLSEPGFWRPTDEEVKGLHDYLMKGGFVIFDDFDGRGQLDNLMAQMHRVLPGHRFVELHGPEEVFHSFFEIPKPLEMIPPYGYGAAPEFHGIFEDNDPNKRLMVVANYNNDIGDYWEWSGTGLWPIDLSNEAYKFGVNYVMYAMTH